MTSTRQILSASLVGLGLVGTSAARAVEARAQITPKGAILLPLVRGDDLTAYYAEFEVGTPPQRNFLKVDTGSPTFSFINPKNSQCVNDACKKWGTYDNVTSSTSAYIGPGFNDNLADIGVGDFISDTVSIGGVKTKSMTFGYIDNYEFPSHLLPPLASIAGFSTNCYGFDAACNSEGPYLMQELKNKSTIDRQSVGLYLGPDIYNTTAAQMIIGGYYDESKFAGQHVTVPMTDPFSQDLSNGQTNSVNVTKISVTMPNNTKTTDTFGEAGVGAPLLLDSGAPTIFLPQDLANAALAGLGNPTQMTGYAVPAYVVDCKYQTQDAGHLTVEFGAGGSVTVPISDFVSKFADGSCATYIFALGSGLRSFGDPFLRSVYTIFDQEAKRVTIGPVKHTTSVTYKQIPSSGMPLGLTTL